MLVIEPVAPAGNAPDLAHLIDLTVFIVCGGRTRTAVQLGTLFAQAGQTITVDTYLLAGVYTLRFDGLTRSRGPLPDLAYTLQAVTLTDPISPKLGTVPGNMQGTHSNIVVCLGSGFATPNGSNGLNLDGIFYGRSKTRMSRSGLMSRAISTMTSIFGRSMVCNVAPACRLKLASEKLSKSATEKLPSAPAFTCKRTQPALKLAERKMRSPSSTTG